jgi:tetratricopeptide (TPR) repeat protein
VQGDDAETLAQVAWVVFTLDRDVAASIAMIDRALALNPGSSFVWHISGTLRMRAGDLDAAVEHLETSIRLDPLSPTAWAGLSTLGRARFHQGRYAEAVAPLKQATQHSDAPVFFLYLAATYAYLGETSAARDMLERCPAVSAPAIADLMGLYVPDPAQLKQLLDGIALAEGKRPSDTTAGVE